MRQLYIDGVRYDRTRTPAVDINITVAGAAKQVADGFEFASSAPLQWHDPSTVELVSDHTWVQHRCPVTSVTAMFTPPAPPPPPPRPSATCYWGPKTAGHSPGSSLRKLPASTYQECQKSCCDALPACKGILFNEYCYLLDRKFEHGFIPSRNEYAADLNCSASQPARCSAFPPLPQLRARVRISTACFDTATKPGALALTVAKLSAFENTGVFRRAGEFYIDQKAGTVTITSTLRAPPTEVVTGMTQTLLHAAGAHDIQWVNLSFAHSGWSTPSTKGIVERYGGTLFKLPPFTGGCALTPSPAAVMVANASRVKFRCVYN